MSDRKKKSSLLSEASCDGILSGCLKPQGWLELAKKGKMTAAAFGGALGKATRTGLGWTDAKGLWELFGYSARLNS